MQVAEGDFQQLEKTATDSEKKWQADTRGEEALKKADAAIGLGLRLAHGSKFLVAFSVTIDSFS